MKKYILILLSVVSLSLVGCSEFLDRPSKTTMNDGNYWTSENNLRLFVNGFYSNYFVGYNSSWGTSYAPMRGYTFADDYASSATQRHFEKNVPSSRNRMAEDCFWLSEYCSSTWCFTWVRKANLLLERIEEMKTKGILDDAAYAHWSGVARFFRAYEYSRLVQTFGDVPYFDKVLLDSDFDLMYKDRDPRGTVMDAVYEDFKYALANLREDDGSVYLNKYGAAGFVTRHMLFEGTWEKYHLSDSERAKKYLALVVEAGDVVMNSGKWSFESDFRSLFGSQNLAGNKEVIMFRHYSASQSITHAVASYSSSRESQSGINLDYAKQFICNDGKSYTESDLPDADKLDLPSMIATRDPRFEATFKNIYDVSSSTLVYATKFIDRIGVNDDQQTNPIYGSVTNTNDAPVMRLGEVVLNWVEAKAELATMGGPAVTQGDIDRSINAIRNRPIDAEGIANGAKKTDPMSLALLPNDPNRDADVPALIWEIRRERRMEFLFEYSRLLDIKRWKKLHYMDAAVNPDILRGIWVDVPNQCDALISATKVGKLQVEKLDGTIVTYDGTNAADMVGFYIPEAIKPRDPFTDKNYLSPVGEAEINQYSDKGKTLTQTKGW